jgi:hypothetical protein
MQRFVISAAALAAAIAWGAPAQAANMCQAQTLTCATTMPIGGYCVCTARGAQQDGTVVARAAPGRRTNATAGGCGSQPNAPGCR